MTGKKKAGSRGVPGATGKATGFSSETKLNWAGARVCKMSVPNLLLARTTAEEKNKEAEPAFLTLKTIFRILPAVPLIPGVGNPPLKEIVPAPLENAGSSTHKEKIEPDLVRDTTSRSAAGKFMTESALLIALFCVLTRTPVFKRSPTLKLPDDGLK